MKPETTPKQRWILRFLLIIPIILSSSYHLIKLYRVVGMVAVSLLLISLILCVVTILVVERKYEYKLPSKSDFIPSSIAFSLVAAVNFGVTYEFHTNNRLEEAVDSVLNILPFLPFLLLVKAKDGKLKSPEVKNS